MSLFPYIVILFVEGLLVGAVARLLLPGEDPMGLGLTATVGLFGSLAAGFFSWYVFKEHGLGLLWAVLFSMLFLLLIRFLRNAGGSRRTMAPSSKRR